MTKKHSTKRALVASVLMLALCFTMLVGTTFAWFTDTVESGNNIIKTGNLDVEMYWADGTKAVPTEDNGWTDASSGAIFNYALWEPGYTEVRHIKIANEGTLALKYNVSIVASGAVSKLADVIDVYYVDPAVQVANRTDLNDSNKLGTLTDVLANLGESGNGTLLAGASDTITIALKMQETAGNEYMNLEIGTEFSIRVVATQLASEKDSFDNQFDQSAAYFEKTSVSFNVPENAEAALEIAVPGEAVALNLSPAALNALPEGVTTVSFGYNGLEINEEAKTLTVKSFELLDQNGEVIDLAGNTQPIVVTFEVPFENGTLVEICHDGKRVATANVENGKVTYETTHFCEITIGEPKYVEIGEEADFASAKPGDFIKLKNDVTLSTEVALPAGATLIGNGYEIKGTIYAGGDLTFYDHVKVTSFSASYYNRVITIPEGACLEITGGNRVTLAYGNTFNITGTITDAKTADKANVQPSLIIPAGISITGGNDATMNVTNAYIQVGNTSSKNSATNGTFTLNFENSIAEFTNQFVFADPTSGKNPTVNVNIKDSVFTTALKLQFWPKNSNVVVDNSVVTAGTYLLNSGNLTVKNGSVVTGSTIQFAESGGGNNGTITVDNSTFTITASSTGHAFDGKDVGKIVAENGAEVSVTYYKDMEIVVDETSTFTGTEVG